MASVWNGIKTLRNVDPKANVLKHCVAPICKEENRSLSELAEANNKTTANAAGGALENITKKGLLANGKQTENEVQQQQQNQENESTNIVTKCEKNNKQKSNEDGIVSTFKNAVKEFIYLLSQKQNVRQQPLLLKSQKLYNDFKNVPSTIQNYFKLLIKAPSTDVTNTNPLNIIENTTNVTKSLSLPGLEHIGKLDLRVNDQDLSLETNKTLLKLLLINDDILLITSNHNDKLNRKQLCILSYLLFVQSRNNYGAINILGASQIFENNKIKMLKENNTDTIKETSANYYENDNAEENMKLSLADKLEDYTETKTGLDSIYEIKPSEKVNENDILNRKEEKDCTDLGVQQKMEVFCSAKVENNFINIQIKNLCNLLHGCNNKETIDKIKLNFLKLLKEGRCSYQTNYYLETSAVNINNPNKNYSVHQRKQNIHILLPKFSLLSKPWKEIGQKYSTSSSETDDKEDQGIPNKVLQKVLKNYFKCSENNVKKYLRSVELFSTEPHTEGKLDVHHDQQQNDAMLVENKTVWNKKKKDINKKITENIVTLNNIENKNKVMFTNNTTVEIFDQHKFKDDKNELNNYNPTSSTQTTQSSVVECFHDLNKSYVKHIEDIFLFQINDNKYIQDNLTTNIHVKYNLINECIFTSNELKINKENSNLECSSLKHMGSFTNITKQTEKNYNYIYLNNTENQENVTNCKTATQLKNYAINKKDCTKNHLIKKDENSEVKPTQSTTKELLEKSNSSELMLLKSDTKEYTNETPEHLLNHNIKTKVKKNEIEACEMKLKNDETGTKNQGVQIKQKTLREGHDTHHGKEAKELNSIGGSKYTVSLSWQEELQHRLENELIQFMAKKYQSDHQINLENETDKTNGSLNKFESDDIKTTQQNLSLESKMDFSDVDTKAGNNTQNSKQNGKELLGFSDKPVLQNLNHQMDKHNKELMAQNEDKTELEIYKNNNITKTTTENKIFKKNDSCNKEVHSEGDKIIHILPAAEKRLITKKEIHAKREEKERDGIKNKGKIVQNNDAYLNIKHDKTKKISKHAKDISSLNANENMYKNTNEDKKKPKNTRTKNNRYSDSDVRKGNENKAKAMKNILKENKNLTEKLQKELNVKKSESNLINRHKHNRKVKESPPILSDKSLELLNRLTKCSRALLTLLRDDTITSTSKRTKNYETKVKIVYKTTEKSNNLVQKGKEVKNLKNMNVLHKERHDLSAPKRKILEKEIIDTVPKYKQQKKVNENKSNQNSNTDLKAPTTQYCNLKRDEEMIQKLYNDYSKALKNIKTVQEKIYQIKNEIKDDLQHFHNDNTEILHRPKKKTVNHGGSKNEDNINPPSVSHNSHVTEGTLYGVTSRKNLDKLDDCINKIDGLKLDQHNNTRSKFRTNNPDNREINRIPSTEIDNGAISLISEKDSFVKRYASNKRIDAIFPKTRNPFKNYLKEHYCKSENYTFPQSTKSATALKFSDNFINIDEPENLNNNSTTKQISNEEFSDNFINMDEPVYLNNNSTTKQISNEEFTEKDAVTNQKLEKESINGQVTMDAPVSDKENKNRSTCECDNESVVTNKILDSSLDENTFGKSFSSEDIMANIEDKYNNKFVTHKIKIGENNRDSFNDESIPNYTSIKKQNLKFNNYSSHQDSTKSPLRDLTDNENELTSNDDDTFTESETHTKTTSTHKKPSLVSSTEILGITETKFTPNNITDETSGNLSHSIIKDIKNSTQKHLRVINLIPTDNYIRKKKWKELLMASQYNLQKYYEYKEQTENNKIQSDSESEETPKMNSTELESQVLKARVKAVQPRSELRNRFRVFNNALQISNLPDSNDYRFGNYVNKFLDIYLSNKNKTVINPVGQKTRRSPLRKAVVRVNENFNNIPSSKNSFYESAVNKSTTNLSADGKKQKLIKFIFRANKRTPRHETYLQTKENPFNSSYDFIRNPGKSKENFLQNMSLYRKYNSKSDSETTFDKKDRNNYRNENPIIMYRINPAHVRNHIKNYRNISPTFRINSKTKSQVFNDNRRDNSSKNDPQFLKPIENMRPTNYKRSHQHKLLAKLPHKKPTNKVILQNHILNYRNVNKRNSMLKYIEQDRTNRKLLEERDNEFNRSQLEHPSTSNLKHTERYINRLRVGKEFRIEQYIKSKSYLNFLKQNDENTISSQF